MDALLAQGAPDLDRSADGRWYEQLSGSSGRPPPGRRLDSNDFLVTNDLTKRLTGRGSVPPAFQSDQRSGLTPLFADPIALECRPAQREDTVPEPTTTDDGQTGCETSEATVSGIGDQHAIMVPIVRPLEPIVLMRLAHELGRPAPLHVPNRSYA